MSEKFEDDRSVREIYSNRIPSMTADGAVVTITLGHFRRVPNGKTGGCIPLKHVRLHAT